MTYKKKYIYNPHTLAYERKRRSWRFYMLRVLVILPISFVVAMGYYVLYTEGMHFKTPHRVRLEREYQAARSNIEMIHKQVEVANQRLSALESRDNGMYRNIFGMEQIGSDVREAGFGGENRYAYLDFSENRDLLYAASLDFDKVFKKTYIQSRSFDDVERMAGQMDRLAQAIPTILPIPEDTKNFRFSSSFGYRTDPVYGGRRMHQGIDLVGAYNSPVYATGDGTVETINFEYNGYGRYVIINHGFGYKTRYAHLSDALVYEGQTIKRGERIGLLGNSGKSSGPHLHYEVIYMGRPINPYNYFNNNIATDQYHAVIQSGSRL